MSIPLLAQATSFKSLVFALAATAVSVVLAFAAGVFRRRSIVGPARIQLHEPVSIIWMLLLLGFGVWIMIPTAYGLSKVASRGAPASTAPSTAPLADFSPEEQVFLGLISAAGALTTLLLANAALRPKAFTELGLTRRTFVRMPPLATLAIVIVLPLMFAASEFTQIFWQMVGLEHPNAHPLLRIFADQSARGLRAMVVLSAVIVAPMFEELIFRGHLQTALLYSIQWLIRPMPTPTAIDVANDPQSSPLPIAIAEDEPPAPVVRWMAILITSFFFTFVHGEIWMMPPIFLLSLCLGYAYERTGNLWVPIFLHATFNAANVALFIWQGQ